MLEPLAARRVEKYMEHKQRHARPPTPRVQKNMDEEKRVRSDGPSSAILQNRTRGCNKTRKRQENVGDPMKTIALGTPARQKIEALKNDPSRCQTVSNGRPLTYDLSCVINRSQSVEVGRVEKIRIRKTSIDKLTDAAGEIIWIRQNIGAMTYLKVDPHGGRKIRIR